MRLKYFMRGIGIGIILTALILSISNPGEKFTDEEIIKRASALGMTMKDDKNPDLDQLLNGIKPTGSTEASITPIITPAITPAPLPSASPIITVAPEQDLTPTQAISIPEISILPTNTPDITITPVNSGEIQEITFSIVRGMSSGKVAKLLEEKGLIDNAEAFNTYIVDKGKASLIKIGTYTLQKGSTFGEIVWIITN